MAVQVCPYHEKLQSDVSGLNELVVELREWKAAQEQRQKNMEEKLEQAVTWMKWMTGTIFFSMLGMAVAIFVKLQ